MIIKAKLKEPNISEDVIYREKIVSRLKQEKHTIIVGSSGYGKTVLLGQIEANRRCVWYTIDEFDNDICIFINYFIAALELEFEGIREYLYRDRSTEAIEIDGIANGIISYLEGQGEVIIKLDNYHYITDAKIKELIRILMIYGPSNLKVVVATRKICMLEYTGLKLENFNLVTEQDLIFDALEQEQYLGEKVTVQEKVLEYLAQEVNQTPIGIRLIKQIYFEHRDKEIEFFFKNLFESVDKLTRKILIVSSYLPYVSIDGMNKILKIQNTEDILDGLIERGYLLQKNHNHYIYNGLFRCDTLLIEKISH